jgi:hypothetical protein
MLVFLLACLHIEWEWERDVEENKVFGPDKRKKQENRGKFYNLYSSLNKYCNKFAGSVSQWKFTTLTIQYTTVDYN